MARRLIALSAGTLGGIILSLMLGGSVVGVAKLALIASAPPVAAALMAALYFAGLCIALAWMLIERP